MQCEHILTECENSHICVSLLAFSHTPHMCPLFIAASSEVHAMVAMRRSLACCSPMMRIVLAYVRPNGGQAVLPSPASYGMSLAMQWLWSRLPNKRWLASRNRTLRLRSHVIGGHAVAPTRALGGRVRRSPWLGPRIAPGWWGGLCACGRLTHIPWGSQCSFVDQNKSLVVRPYVAPLELIVEGFAPTQL